MTSASPEPVPLSPSKQLTEPKNETGSPPAALEELEQIQPAPIEPATRTEMPIETPEPDANRRAQVKTPEPRPSISNDRINGQKGMAERSPSTPGHLAPFDWDEFESRYSQALTEANSQEQKLLEEFDQLVKYFNVWASAASVHDNDRGVKRLQTRERYVKIAEQSLSQKKQHLTEVVRAFQSALALLSQS